VENRDDSRNGNASLLFDNKIENHYANENGNFSP